MPPAVEEWQNERFKSRHEEKNVPVFPEPFLPNLDGWTIF